VGEARGDRAADDDLVASGREPSSRNDPHVLPDLERLGGDATRHDQPIAASRRRALSASSRRM